MRGVWVPRRAGIRCAVAIVVLALGVAVVAAAADPAPGVFHVSGVTPRERLGISYGPRPQQVLDLRVPAVGRDPMPVLVYAHAGGWIAGSRADVPDVITGLSDDLGVAVVSIDYRLASVAADGSAVNAFPTAM